MKHMITLLAASAVLFAGAAHAQYYNPYQQQQQGFQPLPAPRVYTPQQRPIYQQTVPVQGYQRSNGTYVQPYQRSYPTYNNRRTNYDTNVPIY